MRSSIVARTVRVAFWVLVYALLFTDRRVISALAQPAELLRP